MVLVFNSLEGGIPFNLTNGFKVMGCVLFTDDEGDRNPYRSCKTRIIRLKAEPTPKRLQSSLREKGSFVILRFDKLFSLIGLII